MLNFSLLKSKKNIIILSCITVGAAIIISSGFFIHSKQKTTANSSSSASSQISQSISQNRSTGSLSPSEAASTSSQSSGLNSSQQIAAKTSSIANIQTHNVTLVGVRCNGPENALNTDGFCKVLDNGQEVGKIYFFPQKLTNTNSSNTITLAASGYVYIKKLGATSNGQYIKFAKFDNAIGGLIYKYSYESKKVDTVDEFYFDFNRFFFKNSDIIKSKVSPSCDDPNQQSYWEYSCFYIKVNGCCASGLPITERDILTDDEKARIDEAKKDFFYYNKIAPIYGLEDMELEKYLS